MRKTISRNGGFTLVELLTVVALIIAVAALAVPNFAAMIKEQRMTSAINALQVAIMRARTFAINEELDHAVEFATDEDGTTYLRIEAESAFLETIPNLQEYLNISDSLLAIPLSWYHAFIAKRDAWGPDGERLYSGVWDCYWTTSPAGWGHIKPDYASWWGHRASCHLYYDDRYPYPDKASLTWPWQYGTMSIGERNNNAGTQGYQDVNDDYAYLYQSTEWAAALRDNLVVDDYLYLPHSINVILAGPGVSESHASKLINYDSSRNSSGGDVARHGWDGTLDLRFGKGGYLLQEDCPEISLCRKDDDQYVRLQLLKSTGRLKKMQ